MRPDLPFEDAFTILSTNADGLIDGDELEDEDITDAVAAFIDETCDNDCLVTLEFSPIEPDVEAHKYYAPGLGLLAELEDGECITVEGVVPVDEADTEDPEE